jgi:signal transduction histidine kinase
VRRGVRIALIVLGALFGVVAYRAQINGLGPFTTSGRSFAIVVVGVAFIAAGAIAWSPRYPNRIAPLMVATGFLWLARQLRYSHNSVLFTLFFLFGDVAYAMAGHVALAYPSGRVRDKWELWLVRAGYASVLLFNFLILLVYDGNARLHQFDPSKRHSFLLVWANDSVALKLQEAFVAFFYGLLATLFIALIIRRLVSATPRARRLLAPLMIAAVVAALRSVWECIFTFVNRPSSIAYNELFWWQIIGFIAFAFAIVDGLLRTRLAHADVGDLVRELERTPQHRLGETLARALRDRTLEIAFWVPSRGEYVDSFGRTTVLPTDGVRAVTRLDSDGEPVAILIHDPSLLDDPALVEAAAAAARLSLENARLHAETRAQLAQVQESRARIVTAADDERRRIERDIHDGAQQRLVALGLQLRSAQRRLDQDSDPEVARMLGAAAAELQVAVDELRELARGVHPAVLTEEGLAAALESLATRTPMAVKLDVLEDRMPEQVEATAYFVACEALTNIAKHAHASKAAVGAHRENGVVTVEIEDDGIGGAVAQDGSGLRGLADRVEALGGHLTIASPPNGGTRIVAEIPCAS